MGNENPKYLAFVRELPCAHCGGSPAVAHHIIGVGMGCMGGKADDIHSMPMCLDCHHSVHLDPSQWQVEQLRWMMKTQSQAISEGVLVC